jgi:hypothetical protein
VISRAIPIFFRSSVYTISNITELFIELATAKEVLFAY